MVDWQNATGEASEAGNLNDIEARIEAALPAFNQRTWTQKTSATPLSAANLNALEEAAASGQVLVQVGPLTEAAVDALIGPGTTLFETDAGGDVVAEWVKTSA